MRILFFLFVLTLSITSCQDAANTAKSAADKATEVATDAADQTTKAVTDAMGQKKYKLTAFTPSQAYPDALIMGMDYKNGKFNFDVRGKEYKLGAQTPDAPQKSCANSAKGQHIHLIVDNAPYAAKYEPSFAYDLADGEHIILAFLSRSYHESIKTNGASRVRKVQVANGSITKEEEVKEPMLFYSRPKGTYKGKAETDKVMLDFYAYNAAIGDDMVVKANINGEEHLITEWRPFYIEGLPMGENTVTLTLCDKSGATIDTPLNPVTRKFTLEVDEVEVK